MTFNQNDLREALLMDMKRHIRSYSEESYRPVEFSKKHHRKMRQLFRRADRPILLDNVLHVTKRVAVMLLALSLALFTTVMSVEALRDKFFKFFEQKFRQYSLVSYEPNYQDVNPLHKELIKVYPQNLPDGMVISKELNQNDGMYLFYEDADGNIIEYQQLWYDVVPVNPDDVNMEVVNIDNASILYTPEGDYNKLKWNDGSFYYFVRSNLDKESVIEVMHGVITQAWALDAGYQSWEIAPNPADIHGEFVRQVPSYLPPEMQLLALSLQPDVFLEYTDFDGKSVSYTQDWLENVSYMVNTEGAELRPIKFHGYDAYYNVNLGYHVLIWDDGTYAYNVSSDIDKKSVFKVAESLVTFPKITAHGEFKPQAPSYIPSGLNNNIAVYDDQVALEYSGDDGSSVLFQQFWNEDATFMMSLKRFKLEKVPFKDTIAQLYTVGGRNALCWGDEAYTYSLVTTFDREMLFKIAESVVETQN